MIECLTRSKGANYNDYVFSAVNFNKQTTDARYNTSNLDGIYTLTITGSNGFNESYLLNWKDWRWTNISSTRIFYVD